MPPSCFCPTHWRGHRRLPAICSRYRVERLMLMVEERKLAAILAADVVGFSRLTGADEERTLARLRALRSDLTSA